MLVLLSKLPESLWDSQKSRRDLMSMTSHSHRTRFHDKIQTPGSDFLIAEMAATLCSRAGVEWGEGNHSFNSDLIPSSLM